MKPRLIVFASGTRDGGGSGFQTLVENSQTGVLDAHIVAVVSNHENGGVRRRAGALSIPFVYFSAPWTTEEYQRIVKESDAQWVALSGWLKLVRGLPPQRTFNIHPGPLPRFGGVGMYGVRVHKAVIEAFRSGEVTHSAVTMHFVTEEYDRGPIFFCYPVPIYRDDTPETLARRVNEAEHTWQPRITNLLVHEEICWDGVDPETLTVPRGYLLHKKNIF